MDKKYYCDVLKSNATSCRLTSSGGPFVSAVPGLVTQLCCKTRKSLVGLPLSNAGRMIPPGQLLRLGVPIANFTLQFLSIVATKNYRFSSFNQLMRPQAFRFFEIDKGWKAHKLFVATFLLLQVVFLGPVFAIGIVSVFCMVAEVCFQRRQHFSNSFLMATETWSRCADSWISNKETLVLISTIAWD
ncbi:hypothetical protein Tco_0960022 [Tanacetum coccineum]